ncbi:MAG: SurA N-terminal domain-containing protein [Rhodobacteraceae bacterium]|nr:SurA N-terminal domain-containing protein [Paracoccaceae bacterium]
MLKHIKVIVCALALVGACQTTSFAQATIEVVVNDAPITTYDITQRARLITLTQRKSGSIAKRMAKQELIDERIQLGEANRVGVSVSDSEVNGAFGNIARNVKMSPSQLTSALRRSGINPQTLKDRLKAQLAWTEVVRGRFATQIKINDSDVIAALRKSDMKDKNVSIEYDLKRLIVVVPAKSSNSFKSKRRNEANKIRKSFTGCDTEGAILSQYSEVVVKPIGRRLETEIPEGMRKVIEDLGVGSLTKPEATSRGYEMIAICDRREMQSDIAARTEVENELRQKEGQAMSRRYLNEVRRRSTIVER